MNNYHLKYVVLLIFTVNVLLCSAQFISEDVAIQYATRFMNRNNSVLNSQNNQIASISSIVNNRQNPLPELYIINLQGGGWTIMPADNRVKPILAFGDNDNLQLNNAPPQFEEFLSLYAQIIDSVRQTSDANIHPLWQVFSQSQQVVNRDIIVPPILVRNGSELKWDQDKNYSNIIYYEPLDTTKVYNKFCPSGNGCSHTMVGCVAVAMGQIMWGHKWPLAAIVNDNTGQKIIRNYYWDEMPTEICNTTSDYSVNMIAHLLHDCGVSVNMNYDCSESFIRDYETPNIETAFDQVFHYNSELLRRNSYSDQDWMEILTTELDQSRPILYMAKITINGEGHAFVLDGYAANDYFHVNFGWSGRYNGYFVLGGICAHDSYYIYNQEAIIAEPNLSCDNLYINEQTILEDTFLVVNGNSIYITNQQFGATSKGLVMSNNEIVLTSGTTIYSGADITFQTDSYVCEEEIFQDRYRLVKKDENAIVSIPNHWIMIYDFGPVSPCAKYEYFLKDTVINDTTYQHIGYDSVMRQDIGFVRHSEDLMQMYYRKTASSQEYLLCDFSAEIGDTCFLYSGFNRKTDDILKSLQYVGLDILSPWVVTNKTTIDGRIHMTLALYIEYYDYTITVECIQGIGTLFFPFLFSNAFGTIGGAPNYAICALKDDEVLYSYDMSKYEYGISKDCLEYGCKDSGNDNSVTFFPQHTTWKYKTYSYYTDTTYYYQSYIDGDTIINDTSYKILHSNDLGSVSEKEYIHYSRIPVRESYGKIYCRVRNREETAFEDVLLYDFNVSVGDTVMRSYYGQDEDNYAVVTSIEEILLNDGRSARKINYDRRPSDIEYVGSTAGFLYPLYGDMLPDGYRHSFLCCTDGENLLYESNPGDCDSYGKQEPKKKLTTADTWYCVGIDPWGPKIHFYKDVYYVSGDTVVYDIEYKKMYHNTELKGFLRESDNQLQVYWLPYSSDISIQMKTPYLLYDFSAEVGDTVSAYWNVHDRQDVIDYEYHEIDTIPWIVEKKEVVNGRIEMTVKRTYEGEYISTVWIQGVGTAHALWPYKFGEYSSTIYTLCAMAGDETLYSYDLTSLGIINNCPNFKIIGEDVDNLTAEPVLDLSAPMYNVLGLPVGKDYKGIVIQNGRKYVVL